MIEFRTKWDSNDWTNWKLVYADLELVERLNYFFDLKGWKKMTLSDNGQKFQYRKTSKHV